MCRINTNIGRNGVLDQTDRHGAWLKWMLDLPHYAQQIAADLSIAVAYLATPGEQYALTKHHDTRDKNRASAFYGLW